ncbi:hypothetical protein IAR50_003764 [Cryptococcus sp. DSM 104548]
MDVHPKTRQEYVLAQELLAVEIALAVRDQVFDSGTSLKLDLKAVSKDMPAAAKLFAREASHLYLVDHDDTHLQPLLVHFKHTYLSTKIQPFIDPALKEEGRHNSSFANAGMLQIVDLKLGKHGSAMSHGRFIDAIGEDEVGEIFRFNAREPYIAKFNRPYRLCRRNSQSQQHGRRYVAEPYPSKRFEVAYTALFLVSDDASYINGQAIPVDSGYSAGAPFVQNKL